MASYPPRFTGEAFSSPAVGDVTGDSAPEVVVGSNSGALLVYDLAGRLVRSFPTDSAPDAVIASPALVDLNGDGKLDIVVGTIPANDAAAGSTVSAFTGSGQRLWGRKTCRAPGTLCDVFATPAIGDVNGDGVPDVVIGTQDTYVHALRGSDGTDLPGWPVFLADTTWSSASVADLNGDGRAEVGGRVRSRRPHVRRAPRAAAVHLRRAHQAPAGHRPGDRPVQHAGRDSDVIAGRRRHQRRRESRHRHRRRPLLHQHRAPRRRRGGSGRSTPACTRCPVGPSASGGAAWLRRRWLPATATAAERS